MEAGDIAFLKHSTVPHVLSVHSEFSEFFLLYCYYMLLICNINLIKIFLEQVSSDKFELLCKDGSRRPIADYKSCHWGPAPANALVTTTAKNEELRKRYIQFYEVIENDVIILF